MIVLGVIRRRHPRNPRRSSSSLRTLRLCVKLSDTFPPAFPLVSHLPYLLPSSVSCKSFACHSYENCRGVCQQFPFWNSPVITRHYYSSPLLSHACALFCNFLHFFVLAQNSTPLFSTSFALFAKKHGGWLAKSVRVCYSGSCKITNLGDGPEHG